MKFEKIRGVCLLMHIPLIYVLILNILSFIWDSVITISAVTSGRLLSAAILCAGAEKSLWCMNVRTVGDQSPDILVIIAETASEESKSP